ncbi:tol-pal system protein YbgF [Ectothiorhodospira variabilis]|uniref:tol-pal system protein YbgF n=1 Tax=Ectothiorhodospira variabilis TaxID=505694 RepID=UPI001EFB69A5|nr:tol-pal system protein YbgF [Ectothiorhodospira variabilis]MCG5496680.1 tol-pal system protein YbgF [Ectothiorhodospira variabilis]
MMWGRIIPLVVSGVLLTGAVVGPVQAQDRLAQLEERLERLERILENQALMEMLNRMEGMDQDLRDLRGESDALRHELETVKTRQRDLYLDVDQRLERLERAGPGRQAGEPPSEQPALVDPQAAGDDRQAYQDAFNLLREGRHRRSIEAFQGFLENHPDSLLAANAQYWLAEAFYVTRDFEQALKEFSRVLDEHPGSNKEADARLKKGFTHYELGQWDAAREQLTQVRDEHPGTTVARLAEQRLARLAERSD